MGSVHLRQTSLTPPLVIAGAGLALGSAASLVQVIGHAASLVDVIGHAASPLVRRTATWEHVKRATNEKSLGETRL